MNTRPLAPIVTRHPPADAFAAFYDSNVRDVYSFARARVGGDDAEDVTSEVFHAAAIAFKHGREEEISIAWLIGVARNKIIDRWRKAQRHKAKAHLLRPRESDVAVPPDWYDDERRDAVLASVDQLSERHRSLLILHHLDGMPIAEIAEALEMSHSAVESALARARRAFRTEYEKRRP